MKSHERLRNRENQKRLGCKKSCFPPLARLFVRRKLQWTRRESNSQSLVLNSRGLPVNLHAQCCLKSVGALTTPTVYGFIGHCREQRVNVAPVFLFGPRVSRFDGECLQLITAFQVSVSCGYREIILPVFYQETQNPKLETMCYRISGLLRFLEPIDSVRAMWSRRLIQSW